ncbi:unnamed protein product [Ilex paraguariensis]|uniref:Uncharacterized protein n=1 Tax=Ilex paraguariensis TaxID=185542 RepID=A0ABC8SBQ3_9AQUA
MDDTLGKTIIRSRKKKGKTQGDGGSMGMEGDTSEASKAMGKKAMGMGDARHGGAGHRRRNARMVPSVGAGAGNAGRRFQYVA